MKEELRIGNWVSYEKTTHVMKTIIKTIVLVIIFQLFMYWSFAFVSNEFNAFKWDEIWKAYYMFITLGSFIGAGALVATLEDRK